MNLNGQKRKQAALLLSMAALFLAVTPAGYGGGRNQGGGRTTLEFLAPSPTSQVTDFEEVWNEVYKQTDSTLNTRVRYVFTGFDDIGQRVSLRIASGEQLDGAFVAQWTNPSMQQMISQGLLTNLDKYFNNDAYPGLKKYFSPEYLSANSFTDARNETHIYAIPLTSSYGTGIEGFYYRKDLADKYGVGEINSYDKMIQYFDAIKKNEPGMEPFVTIDGLVPRVIRPTYHTIPKTSGHNDLNISGTQVWVAIGDDGVAYAARHFIPEMDPKYRSLLKGPYKDEDPLLMYRIARDWYEKEYVGREIHIEKDHEGKFMAGRAASYNRAVDTYPNILTRFKTSLPNGELGVWLSSDTSRYNVAKVEGTAFTAWNFLAIPTTSKNADRVMALMEWIFSDRSHHDLLEYGIQGKHWIPAGNDKFDYPAGLDPAKYYNFSSYVLTMNPLLTRYSVDTPDVIVNTLVRGGDSNWFYKRADTGFSFVSDSVATETAKLNDLAAYRLALEDGIYSNVEAEVARVQRLYDEAGFARVAAEVERQFNEFLKIHPYEGQ
jgi:putative aldouronate transport system substrate-binding protein